MVSGLTVGSVCSGIEAASIAWKTLGFEFKWFAENAAFPSRVLDIRFPKVPNLGDIENVPEKIAKNEVSAPDIICGGTPCQAFSLAGWKRGLDDYRGNLTLKFVDIVDENDRMRKRLKCDPTIVLWENVEGTLRDKTNAFGAFLGSLVGLDSEIKLNTKWPAAGVIHGPKRNVAWRILDAKFFGVPQQRKRLYVLAGGTSFYPENILFDDFPIGNQTFETPLSFDKEGHRFEIFRSYADCLYAAYGTKWNGNAAAYNGSLFVAQNSKLRRLTPLECERLMGFPDNFTDIPTAKPTQRFQAIGNSWAVPVVNWLGKRIIEYGNSDQTSVFKDQSSAFDDVIEMIDGCTYYRISTKLDGRQLSLASSVRLNGTTIPEKPNFGDLRDIVETGASERYYISPVGCKGILRRKEERQITINPRLEYYLNKTALEWSAEKIEEISRVQKRGKLSTQV